MVAPSKGCSGGRVGREAEASAVDTRVSHRTSPRGPVGHGDSGGHGGRSWPPRPSIRSQRLGVANRLAMTVVVEVDEHRCAPLPRPLPDPLGPPPQVARRSRTSWTRGRANDDHAPRSAGPPRRPSVGLPTDSCRSAAPSPPWSSGRGLAGKALGVREVGLLRRVSVRKGRTGGGAWTSRRHRCETKAFPRTEHRGGLVAHGPAYATPMRGRATISISPRSSGSARDNSAPGRSRPSCRRVLPHSQDQL